MNQVFIRVAAATPRIRVAAAGGVKVLVFPELCLTGYTCSDLFLQDPLLDAAKRELAELADMGKDLDLLVFVGLPWLRDGQLYNVMAAIKDGQILGLVPKTNIPNYSEFYEARHFHKGNRKPVMEAVVMKSGVTDYVPMGTDLLFACANMEGLVLPATVTPWRGQH